jgi:hypothetical protein
MLGVTINYDEAVRFLTKELHVEWVFRPFLDRSSLAQYTAAAMRNNGTIELFGETYTLKQMEELSAETEGKISEFTFGPGGSEGYILLLKMESGQILKAKTFDRNTFELFLSWINRLEGPNMNEPRRKVVEPIPVGSIIYVVENQSAGPTVMPYRLERYEPTVDNAYPLRLADVNPGSAGTYPLSEGWEKWDNIFFRIEDALSFINNKVGDQMLTIHPRREAYEYNH